MADRDIFAETAMGSQLAPIAAARQANVPEVMETLFDNLDRLANSVNNLDQGLSFYLRPSEGLSLPSPKEVPNNDSQVLSKLQRAIGIVGEIRSHVNYISERIQ